MATVTVEVNGRPYNVGCADGQEERVRQLARQFDDNVRQIGRDVGQVGDLRLFLMAALMVSDELSDIRGQLQRLQAAGVEAPAAPVGAPAEDDSADRAAAALNHVADRLERLAAEIG